MIKHIPETHRLVQCKVCGRQVFVPVDSLVPTKFQCSYDCGKIYELKGKRYGYIVDLPPGDGGEAEEVSE
jgi:hypothetical protein